MTVDDGIRIMTCGSILGHNKMLHLQSRHEARAGSLTNAEYAQSFCLVLENDLKFV